ncbi:MAG: GntR family transcriptional regulator [Tagaea sp.]
MPSRETGNGRLPIYLRIQDALTAEIARGAWRPGDALPSEDALARDFGVALGTVRKALGALAAEGKLDRRQGRGTFVRRPDFGNAMFRFFRHADADGVPLRPTARLLARRRTRADAGIAAKLGLARGDELLELFRVRLIDGEPILSEEIALDARRFAPLAALPADAFGDLLYPTYERVCGAAVARASEIIRFDRAATRVAKALGVARDAPVAAIERTAFAIDGAPLEFRRSYGPAERFAYALELK